MATMRTPHGDVHERGSGNCDGCGKYAERLYRSHGYNLYCIICLGPVTYSWFDRISNTVWHRIAKSTFTLLGLSILVSSLCLSIPTIPFDLPLTIVSTTLLFVLLVPSVILLFEYSDIGYITMEEQQRRKEKEEQKLKRKIEKSYKIMWLQATQRERELLQAKMDQEIDNLLHDRLY